MEVGGARPPAAAFLCQRCAGNGFGCGSELEGGQARQARRLSPVRSLQPLFLDAAAPLLLPPVAWRISRRAPSSPFRGHWRSRACFWRLPLSLDWPPLDAAPEGAAGRPSLLALRPCYGGGSRMPRRTCTHRRSSRMRYGGGHRRGHGCCFATLWRHKSQTDLVSARPICIRPVQRRVQSKLLFRHSSTSAA